MKKSEIFRPKVEAAEPVLKVALELAISQQHEEPAAELRELLS